MTLLATPAASPAPAAGRPTDEQIKRGVAAIRAEFPDAIREPYEHWPAIELKSGEKPVELEDLAYCVLKAAMAPEAPAAGEAERLDNRLREIARDPTHTLGPRGVLIEAATLLNRQADLIRTLVEALADLASTAWPPDRMYKNARTALAAARAMGFAKEEE